MRVVGYDFEQKLESVGKERGYFIYHEVPEKNACSNWLRWNIYNITDRTRDV